MAHTRCNPDYQKRLGLQTFPDQTLHENNQKCHYHDHSPLQAYFQPPLK